MTVGHKIAAARRDLGREWTQKKLHAALEKSGSRRTLQWVISVEAGRIKTFYGDDLRLLSRILKKPLDYFTDDPPQDPPTKALQGGVDYLMRKVLDMETRLEALEKRQA